MVRATVVGMCAVFAVAAPLKAQDAEAAFRAAFTDTCLLEEESAAAEYYPNESWTLTWKDDYSDAQQSATLYQFFCDSGAYNVNLVYYLEDQYGSVQPVSFAVPQYDVKYENDDFDGPVEAIRLRGFTTQTLLTNPTFDPDTGSLENHSLWRGIGDASSGGRWLFDKGTFVLKSYDVDASYDGEMNPKRIVEYK